MQQGFIPVGARGPLLGPGWWFWSAVQVLAAGACLLVPLASRPGYESALVLAPVSGLACGMIAIGRVLRARWAGDSGTSMSPGRSTRWLFPRVKSALALVGDAILACAPAQTAALVVLVAGGIARGFCDPWQGVALHAVGPFGCAVAGATLGSTVAMIVPGRRLPYLAWIGVVVASLAWDGWWLWATPQVHVYDHLLGYFAGPIWDEAIGVEWRHLSFRAITLWLVATWVISCSFLYDPGSVRLRLAGRWRQGAAVALNLVLQLALTSMIERDQGIRTSEGAMARALGGETRAGRMILHHSASLSERERQMLAADAQVCWRELEQFFGEAPEGDLELWFFASAGQMRWFTGTGPTSVAKPWLGSSVMVYEPPPHPVMKHEMAHLFSAAWGHGPLAMPGGLWGLAADPMLVEGIAMAADWEPDPVDGHVQSAAILELGLVDPAKVGGLRFFTNQGAISYVMAGSFTRHVWEQRGPGPLRAWYSGESFEQAYGTSQAEAIASWTRMLGGVHVPDRWLRVARRAFTRGSVFERPCPHEVALLVGSASRSRAEGMHEAGVEAIEEACAIAPGDRGLAIARARMLLVAGRGDEAGSQIAGILAAMKDEDPSRASVLELSGDVAWLGGDGAGAAKLYGQALALEPPDDQTRMLVVKSWAVGSQEQGGAGGPGSEAGLELRSYLLGMDGQKPKGTVEKLRGVAGRHSGAGPMLLYVLGRAEFNAGNWKAAAKELRAALDEGLEPDLMRAEALRLMAVSYLWHGAPGAALRTLDELDAMPPPSQAMAWSSLRWRAIGSVVPPAPAPHGAKKKEQEPSLPVKPAK